ncbi:MAG: alpha/beta hydrolase [Bryobacterales bacterium]|nr:alpha/beta hydrolase [Bryobacterales bacterium]
MCMVSRGVSPAQRAGLWGLMMLFGCCTLLWGAPAERNVIYGMHSGLALLMDVYKPVEGNGYGVVVIPGSGWHATVGYGAQPLKEGREFAAHVERLVAKGYTAFVINHRAAPVYRYPDAVHDAQRAVRYVRHHARRYGIRAERIGALGGSSGGHLVNLLGVLDGKGDGEAEDPVERESAKVQTVVALYAPSDMAKVDTAFGSVTVTAFLGMRTPRSDLPRNTAEARLYREASPVTHVSADDPPFLLLHGDADAVVPYGQSETMEAALRRAGVEVKLVRVPGGGHGSSFPGAKEKVDWAGMAVEWFDGHLRK